MNKKPFKYYSSLFCVFFLLFIIDSFAQLSGPKNIPGDYATIEAAISALNSQGVASGGVTFNVAAGHTETFPTPVAGTITASGTLTDQIIFQKSGAGTNPLITAALNGTGTTDGIIKITGGDFITFDGIDIQENSGNLDATTQMEWGYALVKRNASLPVDGCSYITIKNCSITLNKANTSASGIYSGNHLATSTSSITLSDTSDAMSRCKFYSNTISNVYLGIKVAGSTNSSFYDQNNEIGVGGGNNISNFGGGSSSAYGMNVEYQNNIKIANNIINGGGFTQTGALYGIRTGSGTNSNADIYGNTVTLTQGGTSLIYGITNSTGSSGVDNKINIYNNIIENCSYPNSSSNSVWLLYNLSSAYQINIYGNRIRNNSKSAGSGTMHCIYNNPTSANAIENIYDNLIYGNSSAGQLYGIHIAKGTNTLIYGNQLYDLTTTSSSGSIVSGIRVASGPTGVNIFNNFLSDFKAPFNGDDNAVRGIELVSTTANSSIGVYYNTIFLNSTSFGTNFGSSGIYHSNSSTATTAALDLRDNIIVNLSTATGTGKTAAFRRSAANVNLNNYSTLSNNNDFYAGTPGPSNVIFFDGTNSDQTLDDFKLRVTPRETSSITENVSFINTTTTPYDLHVQTLVPTQTNNSGTPITTPIAITSDFDGETRNLTNPDMGADEFSGIGVDITAPSIVYTVFDPTISTANRTLLDVTITDQSGVNVTAGNAPRIYYRRSTDNNTYIDNTSTSNGWKFTETSNINSPFEFIIDYSLLFGGTGVQMGDVIEYFVVAQDLFAPPNVGINIGDFNTPPTSVNLTSTSFPITGTINSYYIISLLNGTITVGTGGDYPSLTGSDGLFNAFNGNFVTGNVTAEIISDIIETGDISLNQWVEQGAGNYTLTIQPNSAELRTISGSSTGGLFNLNGADRVTFDGRFNAAGNYLTLENTNAATNTATIRLLSLGSGQGCTDITIRNCNIKAGANNLSNIFGIFIGSSTGSISTGNAGGEDYDNISILENNISKCREGIFARGTSSDQMNNLIVSGNVIGSNIANEYVTEYGMYLGYAAAPQVTNNEIFNMIYDVSKWGIYFTSNTNNAIVSKNKIYSIKQPGTTGYNSVGIVFWSATNCFDNQIDNNMIYDLSTYGNSSMYLVGIRIAGGSNYKVYYNSVSITDTIGNTATGLVSSCLYISTATSNLDVRNNIFLNARTGNAPRNYAVYSPISTTFSFINHNDYWTTGNVIGYFGAEIANFADWKTATGQDANSINIDPMFTSATDLHINAGTTPILLESGGALISGMTTDFDDDVRPGPAGSVNGGALAPDLGADEFDGVPVAGATFQLSVDVNNGWNMVSIPGLHPINQNVTTWWSGKDPASNCYKFDGGYQSVTIATPGVGYWMKHIGTNTYNTGDEWPAGGIIIVPHDPIQIHPGWNLISVYENPVLASGLTTSPSGLQTGQVFGYSGGYTPATILYPGYAYWLKSTGEGLLNIPNSLSKGIAKTTDVNTSDWGKIVITDASGKSYTLYTVKGEVNLDNFELPPSPPAGMFDVRFGSGRYAEELSAANKSIELNSLEYPVKVRVENASIKLQDETGKIVNERMKAGEEVVISSNMINKMLVSANIIPDVYALEQNYPNPFNPSTKIEFSLPEDVNNVTLTIYNALGQRVAELVNSRMEAGKYSYLWNAGNVATGMYIYELRTDKFVSVKKMLLMK